VKSRDWAIGGKPVFLKTDRPIAHFQECEKRATNDVKDIARRRQTSCDPHRFYLAACLSALCEGRFWLIQNRIVKGKLMQRKSFFIYVKVTTVLLAGGEMLQVRTKEANNDQSF
jgi:hypothetical protein